MGSSFIAWPAWKLVCHPIPNLSAHRRRFQRRRFNKYLNRGLQCGAEHRPGLTLYLHEVIKWRSGRTSVCRSRPPPGSRWPLHYSAVNNESAIVWCRGSAGRVWGRSDERWAVVSCAEGLSPVAPQTPPPPLSLPPGGKGGGGQLGMKFQQSYEGMLSGV